MVSWHIRHCSAVTQPQMSKKPCKRMKGPSTAITPARTVQGRMAAAAGDLKQARKLHPEEKRRKGLDVAAELDKALRTSHIQGGIRNGQSVGVTLPCDVTALPGSQSQLQQKRFRRAWLLEPQQVPVSEVSLART